MGTGYSFPELGSTVSSFQELGGEVACENSYWMVDGLAGEMACRYGLKPKPQATVFSIG